MKSKRTVSLRSIDARELLRVQGGIGMLLPAVQTIRTTAPLASSDLYIKYEGISGEATR